MNVALTAKSVTDSQLFVPALDWVLTRHLWLSDMLTTHGKKPNNPIWFVLNSLATPKLLKFTKYICLFWDCSNTELLSLAYESFLCWVLLLSFGSRHKSAASGKSCGLTSYSHGLVKIIFWISFVGFIAVGIYYPVVMWISPRFSKSLKKYRHSTHLYT